MAPILWRRFISKQLPEDSSGLPWILIISVLVVAFVPVLPCSAFTTGSILVDSARCHYYGSAFAMYTSVSTRSTLCLYAPLHGRHSPLTDPTRCTGRVSNNKIHPYTFRRRTNASFTELFDTKNNDVNISNNNDDVSIGTFATKSEVTLDDNDDDDDSDNRSSVAKPLGILLLSQFILFIGVGAVIPTIPLYGKAIGLSSAANGVVISAPAVALLLGANAAGKIGDIARKPAMMIGMGIICLSDIGTPFAPGLFTLIIARLGLGAGRCLSEAGERGMLADLAGRVPDLRGRALAAQQAAIALGIAIGAPLGGIVVETYGGPRATFLCVSAAAFFALVLYAFLPETVSVSSPTTTTMTTTTCAEPPNTKTEIEVATAEEITKNNDTALPLKAATTRTEENDIFDATTKKEGRGVTLTRQQQGEWTQLLSDRQWRGLAICQSGASFGFAAKISSIPVLAAATLPGGAVGAGALLSVAGLSGLVGALFGGWLTDRAGARATAIASGTMSAVGLSLIPLALLMGSSVPVDAILHVPILAGVDMGIDDFAFVGLVIVWSLGASAQGPALTALAQELAPAGAEATAMALPRAAGDGTYIVAPFLLGLVADYSIRASLPGVECTVAGVATLLGVLALALLGGEVRTTPVLDKRGTNGDRNGDGSPVTARTRSETSFIKIVSVDVPVESVHEMFRTCVQLNPTGDISDFMSVAFEGTPRSTDSGTSGIFRGKSFVTNTHVTIAHFSQLQQDTLHKMYDSLEGCSITVWVTGFLWSESVAAFSVLIPPETEGETRRTVSSPRNNFCHLTLWHAEGTEAFVSNQLPDMVRNGKAQQVRFDEPLPLKGICSFWEKEKTSHS